MKNADKSTEKSAALLAGKEAFDLYLKAISWNLRSMMRQLDMLKTAILETKTKKSRLGISWWSQQCLASALSDRVLFNK